MYRSRGLSARTSSLALKAHRAFNFEQAQRIEVHSRATLFLTAISSRSADLAHKVHWTLCLKPNHALKELETRYAFQAQSKRFSRYALSAKAGRRAYSQAIIRLIAKLRVK